MYAASSINNSIEYIEYLLKFFKFEIRDVFKPSSVTSKDVSTTFIALRKRKSVSSYKSNSHQFWKTVPPEQTNYSTKCIFLFGNKEIAFIRDLCEESNITISDSLINVSYKKDDETNSVSTFSCHQLNVMLSYLYLCRHYFITGDILFTHCYLNSMKMRDIKIGKIICGHNKGFGKFFDDKLPNTEIYMNDLTCGSSIPDDVSIKVSTSFVTFISQFTRSPTMESLHAF